MFFVFYIIVLALGETGVSLDGFRFPPTSPKLIIKFIFNFVFMYYIL
jgi:hypothetical protein